MEALDHDICYQAVRRRDARFDGRFYTGVTSTGIFCRPSCPARTPQSVNVRFFAHAAAASEAGFRPCRRCRPELAPGHPEWNRRADLTGRAMRLIEAGTVDDVGVAGLADRLGVSERHLRRELRDTVGVGPLQLARARRLWLARLLLDQTDLTVTEVAFAAGFSSIRQFNDSIRKAFDAPPSALRRRIGTAPATGTVTLHLPCRGALRWAALHRFLAARAIPGLEEATTDGTFRRHLDGGWLELSAPLDDVTATEAAKTATEAAEPTAAPERPQRLTLRCSLDRLSDLATLVPLVRRVADLDTDLVPIGDHLARDPVLARRLTTTPLARLPGAFDPFEVAVRAVVGQQVSVAAARTLLGRLVRLAAASGAMGPEPGRPDGEGEPPVAGFPTPTQLAATSLHDLGMPQRRRDTITFLARAVADGSLDLRPPADPEEVTRRLRSIPGIGPWTAGYVTMRALGDPDGWPPGDLGLRRSLGCSADELERRAAGWQPWRAYAALLLWHSDPTSISSPVPSRQPSDDPAPPPSSPPIDRSIVRSTP
jgi:AraC family transcriptional regulator of adaptative response / DNA-3-methyladenine glycosylase II